jgi:hypothetical protein
MTEAALPTVDPLKASMSAGTPSNPNSMAPYHRIVLPTTLYHRLWPLLSSSITDRPAI